MKKFLPYFIFLLLTSIASAHHDGTGVDIAMNTSRSPNFILIGVGILVVIALVWIIFSKNKNNVV